MFTTKSPLQKAQEKSVKIKNVFTETLHNLMDANEDIMDAQEEYQEEIQELSTEIAAKKSEISSLEEQRSQNTRMIQRLQDFLS